MKIREVQAALLTLPDDAELILVPNPEVPTVAGLEVLHLAGAMFKPEGTLVTPVPGVHPIYRGVLSPTVPGGTS